MDPKKLEKFIMLLKKHDLDEIEVESEEENFRIKARSHSGHWSGVSSSATPIHELRPIPHGYANAGGVGEQKSEENSSSQNSQTSTGKKIFSPLVGTFYGAPSPDADQFVKVGSRIKRGDTLCIVEAMKIMNEIESEDDGIIKEILVQNGEAVEFNQALFILE